MMTVLMSLIGASSAFDVVSFRVFCVDLADVTVMGWQVLGSLRVWLQGVSDFSPGDKIDVIISSGRGESFLGSYVC
jgi:hypothetical protein